MQGLPIGEEEVKGNVRCSLYIYNFRFERFLCKFKTESRSLLLLLLPNTCRRVTHTGLERKKFKKYKKTKKKLKIEN